MQALELEATISSNREIHLKLPESVKATVAKIIVMFEDENELEDAEILKIVEARQNEPTMKVSIDDL